MDRLPKPIAFVVMPFNVKPTGIRRPDVPSEVDFDALWERVYRPVLADLGYPPCEQTATSAPSSLRR